MREINGKRYMTSGDLGAYVNRSQATIVRWCKYSDQLEERGEERLIPKPIIKNGQRLFTMEQAKAIKGFSVSEKKYGTMAEFNRKRLGKRGKEIEKRAKVRMQERERKQEERKENEIEMTLSQVNRAVDFKDRFKRLKKDL